MLDDIVIYFVVVDMAQWSIIGGKETRGHMEGRIFVAVCKLLLQVRLLTLKTIALLGCVLLKWQQSQFPEGSTKGTPELLTYGINSFVTSCKNWVCAPCVSRISAVEM